MFLICLCIPFFTLRAACAAENLHSRAQADEETVGYTLANRGRQQSKNLGRMYVYQ